MNEERKLSQTEIIQKNLLVLLKEIRRICEKYDIEYFLEAGTLIGAIRHNGFIPWDDDCDVSMTVPNYKKFLKICENELGPEFFCRHIRQTKTIIFLLQE